MILKLLFWIPALLILHTYVVYPLLLITIDKLHKQKKKEPQSDESSLPSVSVLMAVHNEEPVIKVKLEALFGSDYPTEKLEVMIGSDASDDSTNDILIRFKSVYPGLKVICYNERIGKPAVINSLSESAAGEILIITDANVIPGRDTIRKLVRNFTCHQVGLADTRLVNTGLKSDGISVPEVAYISFESKLKQIEGDLWGTMMGPFGGFYAIRKKSYQPNRGNILADDFRICMNVLKKGEKAVSDQEAIVYEDVSNNLADEFNRKVRISAGNFQNLAYFSALLLRPFSILTFCFVSHKVLRWLTPLFWFIVIFTNIILAQDSIFYLVLLLAQVIFIILPPLDFLLKKLNINLVPLRFFTHLYFMNIALFVGFVKYLRGIKSGAWAPTKRYQ
jgi:cellulose synthase/poly-beta-1,6-N-acetylglucosamine synthase-like glycosyltransferase